MFFSYVVLCYVKQSGGLSSFFFTNRRHNASQALNATLTAYVAISSDDLILYAMRSDCLIVMPSDQIT
jgi:hypothetical protein